MPNRKADLIWSQVGFPWAQFSKVTVSWATWRVIFIGIEVVISLFHSHQRLKKLCSEGDSRTYPVLRSENNFSAPRSHVRIARLEEYLLRRPVWNISNSNAKVIAVPLVLLYLRKWYFYHHSISADYFLVLSILSCYYMCFIFMHIFCAQFVKLLSLAITYMVSLFPLFRTALSHSCVFFFQDQAQEGVCL